MLLALSLSSGVKTAGAYAGFAAILGLGVLSLLYFAQAREVKRLREWAGRAPERAQELEEQAMTRPEAPAPDAVAVPAVTGTPSVRRLPARPVASPAGAEGNGASERAPLAAPAMTAAPALASATRYVAPAAPAPEPESSPVPVPAVAPPPAPEARPEPSNPPVLEPTAPAALTAAASRPTAARAAASPRPTPPPSPARPAGNGAQTPPPVRRIAPLPPPQSARVTGEPSARERGRGLLVAGIVVALLIIAGGAFAAAQLLSGGSSGNGRSSAARAAGQAAPKVRAKPGASFSPQGVTVTVLNGTPVAGLAKRVGSLLAAKGFREGQLTNAANQTQSATIASYLPGHRADAVAVAKALPGTAVEPIDPTTKGIACPAVSCASTVVVTVGVDRAR